MLDVFQKKYSQLFSEEGYGINAIGDVISGLGYHSLDAMSSKEAKEVALDTIEQLFNHDIIYVVHWGQNHETLKKKSINIQEAMVIIKSQWFEGAKYEDFFGMATFFYKDWYIEKLKELNIGVNTDWDWEWFSEKIVPKIKTWGIAKEKTNVNES
jgi:hypothetical protein